MSHVIRILILSIVMSLYMIWAFRGIENNPVESLPALAGLVAAFLAPAALIVAIYALTAGRGKDGLDGFAWRCWAVTAGLVALGLLVVYARDTASGGFFRENVIVGGIVLAVLMAAADFGLARTLAYLAPKRG